VRIDFDAWQEILDTVRKNKLRTFLTGFSVAWGILILVVLLGCGQGLARGIEYDFRDDATNSIWMRSGQTSVPWKGLRPGRSVQLTNDDYDTIRSGVPAVDRITSRYFIRGNLAVVYRGQTGNFDVRAVHPDHQFLEKTIVTEGRYLNPLDVEGYRKVAVIGISMVMMTVGDATAAESRGVADDLRLRIAERHGFDPDDRRAVSIWNGVVQFQRFVDLMGGIRAFVWVIGAGTLLAGMVGVSNIMMIAVRERTKEIGVRLAIGATPFSVMSLVMREAILVTSLAGYVGLVAGVGVLELLSFSLRDTPTFRNPAVDLTTALFAIGLLVVAGALAGFLPARRAAQVRPVVALRDE
jgi:putative ABC transport system permease protein